MISFHSSICWSNSTLDQSGLLLQTLHCDKDLIYTGIWPDLSDTVHQDQGFWKIWIQFPLELVTEEIALSAFYPSSASSWWQWKQSWQRCRASPRIQHRYRWRGSLFLSNCLHYHHYLHYVEETLDEIKRMLRIFCNHLFVLNSSHSQTDTCQLSATCELDN